LFAGTCYTCKILQCFGIDYIKVKGIDRPNHSHPDDQHDECLEMRHQVSDVDLVTWALGLYIFIVAAFHVACSFLYQQSIALVGVIELTNIDIGPVSHFKYSKVFTK